MKSYDSWLEAPFHQQDDTDAHREYIWHNYMKPGEEYDVMNLEVFQEHLAEATASYAGAEKWENLRQYADRGEWEKFGRAIYYLVHDHIENQLID